MPRAAPDPGAPIAEILEPAWQELTSAAGIAPTAATPLLAAIRQAYDAPGRYYHTLTHIADLLRILRPLRPRARDWRVVEWAAWLHDVVYEPLATDNEARSADWARERLRAVGVAASFIERVAVLVNATAVHTPTPSDVDCQLLLDGDLAPLGSSPAVYDRNARAIWREYARVPEAAFRAGRRHVLTTFLARPRIFQLPEFAALEAPARANISREIAVLTTADNG